MSQYSFDLPDSLKNDAERLAHQQGVSLEQFILWSVAEKVAGLLHALDDPNFPHITYRRGASGSPTPVLRGTGLRIQTIVIEAETQSPGEIAENYSLTAEQVHQALQFYELHRAEIDGYIRIEAILAPKSSE